jgi:hypothetical protein
MKEQQDTFEPNLVPILRQGIEVVKMVLYAALKPVLADKYSNLSEDHIHKLAGAAVNRLFGVQNMEASHMAFEQENEAAIDQVLQEIPKDCDHLKIPLTDALRMQFLCDSHEGVNSESVLETAKFLDVLILDREVPMPGAFMSIARSFGVAYKILEPLPRQPKEAEP